ncbi:geranylgeranyl diphosphate reductase [Spirosoma terrae]|uniref:NAD(P)/FAD-dependent oxidoreductase n=1 Tax=Spirosoma terrae TaxID=1968276 RepID=A0A6L9LDY8_9BACT|nr:NAD(P)/FAD-dependent oxidoreductase [Spirosoma terrae]NDU98756.1 NAD(P)/FAD-dependent oxidoreductase [Spirosoma terrae]
MADSVNYDLAIIGGGLAGLTLAIQCAQAGDRVVLFEKKQYPFHKVCGEYISNESKPFLERLGLSVTELNLPSISTLQVSSVNGQRYTFPLPKGGFGISRYELDHRLYQLALQKGVVVYTGTKVQDVQFQNDQFVISTPLGEFVSRLAVGSYGKRSNLDSKWNRSFLQRNGNASTNYIGVKYHIKFPHPEPVIALHNFPDGYCGISRIEDGKSCLCYLTTAANLNKHQNDIGQMERESLCCNPYLKELFSNAQFLYKQPLVIAQVSFQPKTQVENHMLMVGDSAGLITPLCGNGMSMAMHSGLIAFQHVQAFLRSQSTRQQMEQRYARQWQRSFSTRLMTGRIVQRFTGSGRSTDLFLNTMNQFPALAQAVIRSTSSNFF